MASEIVLPQWGMEMQDGTIVRWLKQEGDTVAEGEPIVEVETAKLQTELESTTSGILSRIVAQEGQIVPNPGRSVRHCRARARNWLRPLPLRHRPAHRQRRQSRPGCPCRQWRWNRRTRSPGRSGSPAPGAREWY